MITTATIIEDRDTNNYAFPNLYALNIMLP